MESYRSRLDEFGNPRERQKLKLRGEVEVTVQTTGVGAIQWIDVGINDGSRGKEGQRD